MLVQEMDRWMNVVANTPCSTGPWACQVGTVLDPAGPASSGQGSSEMASAWRHLTRGTDPAVVGTDCSARTADHRNLPGRRKLEEMAFNTFEVQFDLTLCTHII